MLEIIFAHRNKAYGAYQLRHAYNQYLLRAFALGVAFIIGLFALPHLLNAIAIKNIEIPESTTVTMSTPPDLTPEITPPPPVPPTPPPPAIKSFTFVPPLVVEDPMATQQPFITVDSLLNSTGIVSYRTFDGPVGGPGELPGTGEIPDFIEDPKPQEPEIYTTIDIQKMPSFPGGDAALMAYLRDNTEYPTIAKESNISGTVALQFVVGKDGHISDIKVLKDPGAGLAKEAIRVVQSMPPWTPGEANGHPVKVRFTLPVRFRLE